MGLLPSFRESPIGWRGMKEIKSSFYLSSVNLNLFYFLVAGIQLEGRKL
jgi:hypothetical protein